MKTAYYAVFYQLLRFTFWVRTQDTQEWSALFFFTFLQFLNVAAVYAAVGHELYPYGHRVPIAGVVAFGILLAFGNYRLLRGNPVFKHPATIHQQKHRPSTAWLVGAYVVLTGAVAAYYLKQVHDVNVSFRH